MSLQKAAVLAVAGIATVMITDEFMKRSGVAGEYRPFVKWGAGALVASVLGIK